MNQPYFCFCLFSLLSFAGRLVDLCFAYLSKQNLSLAQLTHMGFCGVGKCAVNPFICTDVHHYYYYYYFYSFNKQTNAERRIESTATRWWVFIAKLFSRQSRVTCDSCTLALFHKVSTEHPSLLNLLRIHKCISKVY